MGSPSWAQCLQGCCHDSPTASPFSFVAQSPSSTTLPKRIPNVRHFRKANTTGLIVLQQQQLSVSKLNGVSHVQSERRRRRLREKRCDGSEQVLRDYTLHSNSFNLSTNWYGNRLQQQLLHKKILHRQLAVVCRATGDGAVFSSDFGSNNSYASVVCPREREYKSCSWVFMSLGQNVFMSLSQNVFRFSCPRTWDQESWGPHVFESHVLGPRDRESLKALRSRPWSCLVLDLMS